MCFPLRSSILKLRRNAIELAGSDSNSADKYIERIMRLTETKYIPLCERTEKVGKVTFIVSSYADSTAEKKPEQLILQLLENKINNETMEESA